jgi:hypothetical protein
VNPLGREGFKEHGILLYLSPALYIGFTRLQADKGLGRSYAGLLAFTEGLHSIGYLNEDDYLTHIKRYSQKLTEQKQESTLQQSKEKEARIKLEQQFSDVIKQWATMKESSRKYYVKKALENKDKIPNAKLVLALARKGPRALRNESTIESSGNVEEWERRPP